MQGNGAKKMWKSDKTQASVTSSRIAARTSTAMRCLRALVIVIHAVAKPRSGVRLYCQMWLRSRVGPFNFSIQFFRDSSIPANHLVACEILVNAAYEIYV